MSNKRSVPKIFIYDGYRPDGIEDYNYIEGLSEIINNTTVSTNRFIVDCIIHHDNLYNQERMNTYNDNHMIEVLSKIDWCSLHNYESKVIEFNSTEIPYYFRILKLKDDANKQTYIIQYCSNEDIKGLEPYNTSAVQLVKESVRSVENNYEELSKEELIQLLLLKDLREKFILPIRVDD